jgi:hypothetical protein
MKPKYDSPEWWREYRLKNLERIRANDRKRRGYTGTPRPYNLRIFGVAIRSEWKAIADKYLEAQ